MLADRKKKLRMFDYFLIVISFSYWLFFLFLSLFSMISVIILCDSALSWLWWLFPPTSYFLHLLLLGRSFILLLFHQRLLLQWWCRFWGSHSINKSPHPLKLLPTWRVSGVFVFSLKSFETSESSLQTLPIKWELPCVESSPLNLPPLLLLPINKSCRIFISPFSMIHF